MMSSKIPPIQRVALVMCGSFNPITNMHLRMFELARDALRNSGYDPVIGYISPVSDGYKKKDLASAEHRCNIIKGSLRKPHSWIHLDTWECSQPNWTPTRDVLEHFQKKLDDWWEHTGKYENVEDTKNHSPKAESHEVDIKRPKISTTNGSEKAKDDDFQIRQQSGLAAMYEEDARRRSPSPQHYRPPRFMRPSTPELPIHPGVRVMFLCGADLFESFAIPGLWADSDVQIIAGQFGIVCINRYGSNADRFIYESDLLNVNRHNIFIVTDWIVNEISSTKVRRALRRGESVRYLLQDDVADYIYENKLYGAIPPLGDSALPHSFAKHFPVLTKTEHTQTENNNR